MPSFPRVDNPEDHWKNQSCRHHCQTNVNPAAVFFQTMTLPTAYVSECIPNRSAGLQIRQEFTVTVENVAQICCSFHLSVECGSQPAAGLCTSTSLRNLTHIFLPYLLREKMPVLGYMQIAQIIQESTFMRSKFFFRMHLEVLPKGMFKQHFQVLFTTLEHFNSFLPNIVWRASLVWKSF